MEYFSLPSFAKYLGFNTQFPPDNFIVYTYFRNKVMSKISQRIFKRQKINNILDSNFNWNT